ncbi:MAG TPA: hypothetical protein VFG83_00830 [Kofleriaceae bacterium]|nr:hypothetical protein [Kofleriaceae bacterium]
MHTHKLILSAAAAAFALAVPGLAHAQPGAAPPPPNSGGYYANGYQGYYATPETTAGGFFVRQGWTAGAGLGFGGLDTDSGVLDCFECDYDPTAVGLNAHLGYMINPRVQLLGEVWAQFQQIDVDGYGIGYQSMVLAAIQFWALPQLWLKGGLGVATLGVTYDDGYDEELAEGAALMLAAGYEVYSAPDFAVDLELRVGAGSYPDADNGFGDSAQSVMLSLGFDFY